ncbi:MAG: 50S ribosomal protein L13 [Thermoleophilia bacterium]|nr:50S ribosomal protein L13 [Thermoleophilia bacterium]
MAQGIRGRNAVSGCGDAGPSLRFAVVHGRCRCRLLTYRRIVPAAHLTKTTKSAKPGDVERRWYIVDAEGQNLGRLATIIAETLRGKRSPFYTPHADCGDFVVVVNAEKIAVTGNKMDDKLYWRHSGYPGGIRKRTLREQLERRPEEVIRMAVRGMLPKNSLGRKQLMKMKVYAGPEHPHEAQSPEPLRLERKVTA